MKAASKKSISSKDDLDPEMLKVIRSMAVALAQTAIKFTPAQKQRVLKEFARVYLSVTRSLGTAFNAASRTKQRELEKEARKRGARFRNGATAATARLTLPVICCVGHPSINNQGQCEGMHPPGTWAC